MSMIEKIKIKMHPLEVPTLNKLKFEVSQAIGSESVEPQVVSG